MTQLIDENLRSLLTAALARREEFINTPKHREAFRLFNGFIEGAPELVIEIFGRTAVIMDHTRENALNITLIRGFLLEKLDFLQAVIHKQRYSDDPQRRLGTLIYGEKADTYIVEHNVKYAIDLFLNQDCSFYSDTRDLRKYLLEHSAGKRVLNTFAYTGSLGTAAAAGGAEKVLQSDLSGKFLAQAFRSASLNGFAFTRKDLLIGDFFPVAGKLRKSGELFDCVILDPPYFSQTDKGKVDLANDPVRLINKLRPLVADNGRLIVVNNSLFLSGREFLAALEKICADGCCTLESTIGIPTDYTADLPPEKAGYPADPAPFDHPTKIAVLKIRRK